LNNLEEKKEQTQEEERTETQEEERTNLRRRNNNIEEKKEPTGGEERTNSRRRKNISVILISRCLLSVCSPISFRGGSSTFICLKSSNLCDLVVEKSGEKSQYFTAFNSLHQQPPLQISKRDLELEKGT
jgi:hypothetical protein